MWPATDLTEELGVRAPILQAPMWGGIATPELAAAVGEAGGVGALGTADMPSDRIADAVAAVRARTDAPLHLDLALAPPTGDGAPVARASAALHPFREELDLDAPDVSPEPEPPTLERQVEAVCGARPAVVSVTGGVPPETVLRTVRSTGALVLATATTVTEGIMLADTGLVDVIVAQGAEAGGPRATFAVPADHGLVGTLALVQGLRAAVRRPVIAAGGIMTGEAIRAALALGAVGVMMGTAFVAVDESGADGTYANAVKTARDDGTVVTRAFTGRPERVVRNRFVMEVADAPIADYPAQAALTAPIRRAAAERRMPELRALRAGQGAALARRVPVGDLMTALEAETGMA
ncbi:nitronate monooxygenase [Limimonas halophila]|uniref:Propionate 3-nitronate monooxygenase n=1 Tax=Limimonas halophila TaxID=1082479 RepID=A0A1G7LRD9_9PROT|nr:nitronate monooxygenase [Limimonas halophila]SDF52082.1 nitronate monooxygenase [Limimonas halophila]